MAAPYDIALPPNLTFTGDYIIRVTAVSATDGSTVAGVDVSDVNLQVDNIGGTALGSGSFKVVNPVLVRQQT